MVKKLHGKIAQFQVANTLRERGLYPYFRPIESAQDTEVLIDNKGC